MIFNDKKKLALIIASGNGGAGAEKTEKKDGESENEDNDYNKEGLTLSVEKLIKGLKEEDTTKVMESLGEWYKIHKAYCDSNTEVEKTEKVDPDKKGY